MKNCIDISKILKIFNIRHTCDQDRVHCSCPKCHGGVTMPASAASESKATWRCINKCEKSFEFDSLVSFVFLKTQQAPSAIARIINDMSLDNETATGGLSVLNTYFEEQKHRNKK